MRLKCITAIAFSLFFLVGFAQDGDVAKKGQDVSNLVFTVENGKQIKMSDYKDKVVFINFFANWCPPCKLEMPHLEKDVWQQYKGNENFVMFGFARGDDLAKVQKFQKDFKTTFAMHPDASKAIYNNFATKYIPRNYIIKNGKIVYASTGFKKDEFDEMVKLLGTLLKE
ncbi:TlpA disulfide reductase family protein [uncultured Kordia sp.]|uniref:TlpA family protein disulfide reductase n=1 Tax=uncultured Kordia sp. TaxID=507699 RepID=UPI00261B89FE|nr:TlpA disulfide reductase family protein [uncultured Kordia sp.]